MIKKILFRTYVITVYAPSFVIGTVLSVFLMPLAFGWMFANEIIERTDTKLKEEVKNGK